MKGLIALLCLLTSSIAFAGWKSETKAVLKQYKNECKAVEVAVDQIVRDELISGHIDRLPADAYEKFKVIFYVKTNRWYVHPYTYQEGQGPGISYAHLNERGEFRIKTVRRDVPAKQLAVVLVPRPVPILAQRFLL